MSRAATLGTGLEELGCAGLVVVAPSSRDPDLASFVGDAHLRGTVLVWPLEERPRLAILSPMERTEATRSGIEVLDPEDVDLDRWSREARDEADFLSALMARALTLSGLRPGPVALAGTWPAGTLHTACGLLEEVGWGFVPGHELLRRLRRPKSHSEIEEIRRLGKAVEKAFFRVAGVLAQSTEESGQLAWRGAPLRVGILRREVAAIFGAEGLEQPEGSIIAPAEEGAVPHTVGEDDRPVRPRQSLIVDLFPKGRFFADCTRTFCVGEPGSALEQAHASVREALELATREAAVGVSGWGLQQRTCALLEARGYPTPLSSPGTLRGFVHGIGHGVGFELHELPSFREKAEQDGVLAPGDVFALEPGIYEPEAGFGVRLEDLFAVLHGGEVERLVSLPYELDPRQWSAGEG